jgi:hypothetical protein
LPKPARMNISASRNRPASSSEDFVESVMGSPVAAAE